MNPNPVLRQAPTRGHGGFTLMEVLVALTIVGISLGVALAAIGMGHRQALRGDQAREAAELGGVIIRIAMRDASALPGDTGEIKGYPGWRYQISQGEAVADIEDDQGQTWKITPEGLQEVTLILSAPGGERRFVLTGWIPEAQP